MTSTIVKATRAIFSSPKKDIESAVAELEQIVNSLLEINKNPNKVEAIVDFFNVTSPVQDRRAFEPVIASLKRRNYNSKTEETITCLEQVNTHISRGGRCEFGFNRTKKGEVVTSENVFLGDVFGIWTKTAHYWLEGKNSFENQLVNGPLLKNGEQASVWDCINSYQCGSFIETHTKGLAEKLELLKKIAA